MKRDDEKVFGGTVFLIMLLFVLFGAMCPSQRASRAGAQVPTISPVVALGRTGVREAGLRAYLRDDTAAIDSVVRFRAEHIYHSDYTTALLRATRQAPLRLDRPRPWIIELDASIRRPRRWPSHLRWNNGRDWSRTLAHAGEVYRGEREHRCVFPVTDGSDPISAQPHDWGSEHDAIRYREEHPDAIELDCGQTCSLDSDGNLRRTQDGLPRCNIYFHIPRLERRFGSDDV